MYNNQDDLLQGIQTRYPFKNSLFVYMKGKSGTPEQQAQKALIACLMAEFPKEIGLVLIPQPKTPHEPKKIFTRLIVSVADFHDTRVRYTKKGKRVSTQMQRFKAMGYQEGTLDIGVMYPYRGYFGFWCEMKHAGGHYTAKGNVAKPGKVSKEQQITIDILNKSGYYACAGIGFPDALGHWLTYLGR